MKVLALSPHPELIEDTIVKAGDDCIVRSANFEVSDWPECDWVVCFGYRKIIQPRTIFNFRGRIINIHISLLPWNRGADPNFWSWFDDTPKGVTIHLVDAGIDTGPILANRVMGDFDFRENGTLRTTYGDLQIAASGLFARSWSKIRKEEECSITRIGGLGSYHKCGEADKFLNRTKHPFEIPVLEVKTMGSIYNG